MNKTTIEITPFDKEAAEMRSRGLTYEKVCEKMNEIDPTINAYPVKLIRAFEGKRRSAAKIEKIWEQIKKDMPVLIDLDLAQRSHDNHIINICQQPRDPDQRTPQNAGQVPAGAIPAGTTGDFL